MSFGIIEVISLLLGMSGFGLQQNPKAPTADQALEYAVPDADLVSYFDATSVVPGNYKVLTQLADQPQIKASPELSKMVRELVTQVEGPRGMARSLFGIDFVTDVSDATAFFQFVPQSDPNMLIAVHGKFSTTNIDKIAKMANKQTVKVGSGSWADVGDGNAIAVTKSGVLLFGSSTLIKARLEDTWKAPAHGPGTNLGYAAELLAGKPVFAVAMTLSQASRADIVAKIGGQNFATDVISRHKFAGLAVFHDGVSWTWIDSKKDGLEAMAQMSEGVVDLLRAAQVAPRGFAKIVMGALESYRGINKQIDAVVSHKADIWKIVDTYTGDGKFQAKVDKDPAKLRLTVRLTGKSLSDVLPLGGIVPLAAVGLLAGRGEAMPPTVMMPAPATPVPPMRKATPPPPPPPPGKTR